jgi:hypothetical protein
VFPHHDVTEPAAIEEGVVEEGVPEVGYNLDDAKRNSDLTVDSDTPPSPILNPRTPPLPPQHNFGCEPFSEVDLPSSDMDSSEPTITLATAVSPLYNGRSEIDVQCGLYSDRACDTVPAEDFFITEYLGNRATKSSHNSQQPIPTAKETLPLCGLRFGYLVHFLVPALGGRDELRGKSTAEVKPMIARIANSKPTACLDQTEALYTPMEDAASVSMCDFLVRDRNHPNAVKLEADWYIIHPHSYLFLDVLDSIEDFLLREHVRQANHQTAQDLPHDNNCPNNSKRTRTYTDEDYSRINEVAIWMDIFCLPQQLSGSSQSLPVDNGVGSTANTDYTNDRTVEWFQYKLTETIRSIGNVLLVCLPTITSLRTRVLSRAWCVMEMFACLQANPKCGQHPNKQSSCRFELTSVPADVDEFEQTLTHSGCKSFLEVIGHEDASIIEQASATCVSDTHNIHNTLLLSILSSSPSSSSTNYKEVAVYQQVYGMLRDMLERWLLAFINKKLSQLQQSHLLSYWQFALADAYKCLGKAEVAIPVAVQALDSRAKTHGYNHVGTRPLLLFIGELYEQTGAKQSDDFKLAEQYYIRCLQITESQFGLVSPESLHICRKICNLFKLQPAMRGSPQRLAMCVQITNLCERVCGSEHPDTVEAWIEQAAFYTDTGRAQEAEVLLLRAGRVCERVHGTDHAVTLLATSRLADVCM